MNASEAKHQMLVSHVTVTTGWMSRVRISFMLPMYRTYFNRSKEMQAPSQTV